jgi:hypothetical protein
MPETSTCARDGKRRPFQHAGEVTRKKEMANAEEVDEEAPLFTKPKIGGAKDVLGKSFELADATNINAGTKPDLRTIGGIRAEDVTSADGGFSNIKNPVHLLNTQPGWRRHWGTLTQYQAWAWTDLPKTFISGFCKACFETGTHCVSRSRALMPLDDNSRSACENCSRTHNPCNWLIAYQSHPLEDIDIASIPDYRTRVLARQNRLTVGTALEIPKSAAIIQAEPEPKPPVKVEPPTTQACTVTPQPGPTYSQARSAYEDLVAREYDDQCKRKSAKTPIDWNSMPVFWEAEVAMGRLGDTPMSKSNQRISSFRAPHENLASSVDMHDEWQWVRHDHVAGRSALEPTIQAPQYSHAPTFSRETQHNPGEIRAESSTSLELPSPPKFVFGQSVHIRYNSTYVTGTVTNRKLGKTWMYHVLVDDFSGLRKPWWPEHYLSSD